MPSPERIVQNKFALLFKARFPKGFYYKIPDTKGTGGRRPFDAFAVVKGVPYAIEFKSRTGKVSPLQTYNLEKFFEAGGGSEVVGPDRILYTLAAMEDEVRRNNNGEK